jgi:L-threonylcarbamoyladenylate synthase
VVYWNNEKMNNWRNRKAVNMLNQGGVIAYPTEAVFGLGCDPWDEDAVMELLHIKQRPWDKGVILIAASFNQLQDFIQPVDAQTLAKMEQTWPGPVTWLLPASEECPEYLTGSHETIAVRVTAHQPTIDLCNCFGGALVSTSANLAGQQPAKFAHQVRRKLPEVDYVMPGSCGGADKPSQIIDAATGNIIR